LAASLKLRFQTKIPFARQFQKVEAEMKENFTKILIAAGLLAAASIASPPVRAQAGPGPLHPAPQPDRDSAADAADRAPVHYAPLKKENLTGTWLINPDLSDDAHQKIAEARGHLYPNSSSKPNSGSGNPPNSGNGPYPGSNPGGNGPYPRTGSGQPYPGGGPGGNGPGGSGGPGGSNSGNSSGRRSGPYSSEPTLEDRQQMQDLIEPATSVTFTQKNGEVDVTDEAGRKRVFFTDGRTPQPPKDENYLEASARWDGATLTSNETGLHGGKITRVFELTPDGRELSESVSLTNPHLGVVTIRYVYDVSTPTPAKKASAR
jgi:hypothetical protein